MKTYFYINRAVLTLFGTQSTRLMDEGDNIHTVGMPFEINDPKTFIPPIRTLPHYENKLAWRIKFDEEGNLETSVNNYQNMFPDQDPIIVDSSSIRGQLILLYMANKEEVLSIMKEVFLGLELDDQRNLARFIMDQVLEKMVTALTDFMEAFDATRR